MPSPATLTLRQLNRALLARQLLLGRTEGPAPMALERLVALQAQNPSPPYFGLWTRLSRFTPAELFALRDSKAAYRTALLRSTLHWVSREDFVWMRPTIQPALERAWQGFFGKRKEGIVVASLVEAARGILNDGPLSLTALSAQLCERFPQWNQQAMEYGVRTHLPLVQVPPAGAWQGPMTAKYEVAAIGEPDEERLVRRYLKAFGPATHKDVAAWAGYTAIGRTMLGMARELSQYTGPGGEALYDLPDQPLPPEETPAPVRFIPELDNLVLGHADRTRILPAEFRNRVLLTAGRVLPTILVDGFVSGVWKWTRTRRQIILEIEPFRPWPLRVRKAVEAEASAMLKWGGASSDGTKPDITWKEC